MNFTKFENGSKFTIGAELEIRLLNKKDLSLANKFDFIYENLDKEYKAFIAPEFLKSLLEINTPVFNSPKDLVNYLKKSITYLKEIAQREDLCLSTSGAYALENHTLELSSKSRYESLKNEHQVLLDDFTICGFHIHIGFENFNKALKAYNFSLKYLPILLAVSASSVFINGKNSGIDSYRTKIFDRLPKSSIPEYFDSYEEINSLYELLYETKVIESPKDIWWDIRIQSELKTLEFRVCDAVNDYDRLEVLTILALGVCKLSEVEEYEALKMQILKQNMWSATRYSMNGSLIFENGKISIKQALGELANKLLKKELITLDEYEKIKKYQNKDSISKKMKDEYQKSKNLKNVERIGVFE